MSARTHRILALLLLATGCAHTRPARPPSPAADLPDLLETDAARGRATPSERALAARALEAMGRPDEAWDRWLAVAHAPDLRAWALARLSGLLDRVALTGPERRGDTAAIALASMLPDSAPLLRALAYRLGDTALMARAATPLTYRVTARLLPWPGRTRLTPGVTRDLAATMEARTTPDGSVASRRGGAGVYAYRLELPAGRHHLRVTTEGAAFAFAVDEAGGARELVSHDALAALLPRVVDLDLTLAPGETLELHLADRTSLASATITPRTPIPTELGRGPIGATTTDADLLAAADRARAQADVFRMDLARQELTRRLASDSRHTLGALARLTLVELLLADRSMPADRARAEARRQLELLTATPSRTLAEVRLVLGRLLLAEDPAAARDRLAAWGSIDDEHDDPALVMVTLEALAQTGERRLAFARAAALATRLAVSCAALDLMLDAGFDDLLYRPTPPTPFPRLAPADPACLALRWREVALARATFALDAADALLAPLVADTPPVPELGALSRAGPAPTSPPEPSSGTTRAPGATGSAPLPPGPARARAHLELASLEIAARRPERALWHLARASDLGEEPTAIAELTRRAATLAGRDPGDPPPTLTETPLDDVRPLLERLRPLGPDDGGTLTLRSETRLFVRRDGAMTVLRHELARPLDKKAVEALGEVVLPDGAEVLVARTWKRVGHRFVPIEPEEILEKDTLSMPALAVGDVVEWAFSHTLLPDPRIAPGWVAPPLRLDREEGPVHRAVLELGLEPGAAPPIFAADPATLARLTTTAPKAGGQALWRFEGHDLPQALPEPDTPRGAEHRLELAIASAGVQERLREALLAELALASRSSPATAALVAEALATTPGEQPADGPLAHRDRQLARLARVYSHLMRAIEEPLDADVVGPRASDATTVAHRRRGARALPLIAACRELALPCDLVLARPLWDGPPPAYLAERLDLFTYPLVRVDGGALWLDPSGRFNPFGVLPPGLLGRPGVAFALPPAAGSAASPVTTPAPSTERVGLRRARIALTFSDPRAFTARGDEALTGAVGASWRHVLAPLQAEHRARILGAVVQQVLPGVTIDEVALDALEAPEEPLRFRWRARGEAQPAGGRMASLGIALMPESLAKTTVRSSQREQPLLVNLAVALDLEVTVAAPPGHGFPSVPRDIDLDFATLALTRKTTFSDGGRVVTLSKHMTLLPTIIPPDRYAAWSEAAQSVDRADLVQLLFGPGAPSASDAPNPRAPRAPSTTASQPLPEAPQ